MVNVSNHDVERFRKTVESGFSAMNTNLVGIGKLLEKIHEDLIGKCGVSKDALEQNKEETAEITDSLGSAISEYSYEVGV